MKKKARKNFFVVGVVLVLFLVLIMSLFFVNAQDSSIEVLYAAEFIANPVNVESDSWIVQLAGGENNDISILYGVVLVHTGIDTNYSVGPGQNVSLEFIEIGSNGRFWKYGGGAVSYDSSNITSEFWYYRNQLNEEGVVDISQPDFIEAITLVRYFDESGGLIKITLNGQHGQKGRLESKGTVSGTNIYDADMNTLIDVGDPSLKAIVLPKDDTNILEEDEDEVVYTPDTNTPEEGEGVGV